MVSGWCFMRICRFRIYETHERFACAQFSHDPYFLSPTEALVGCGLPSHFPGSQMDSVSVLLSETRHAFEASGIIQRTRLHLAALYEPKFMSSALILALKPLPHAIGSFISFAVTNVRLLIAKKPLFSAPSFPFLTEKNYQNFQNVFFAHPKVCMHISVYVYTQICTYVLLK